VACGAGDVVAIRTSKPPSPDVQIRAPHFLRRIWGAFVDWGDRDVYRAVRRIDLVLIAAGVFCAAYYGWHGGWLAALTGGLLFVFILMIALWFLRP